MTRNILHRLFPSKKSQTRDEQLRLSVGPPPLEVPRKATLMGETICWLESRTICLRNADECAVRIRRRQEEMRKDGGIWRDAST
jgi:hypothetical protein